MKIGIFYESGDVVHAAEHLVSMIEGVRAVEGEAINVMSGIRFGEFAKQKMVGITDRGRRIRLSFSDRVCIKDHDTKANLVNALLTVFLTQLDDEGRKWFMEKAKDHTQNPLES